MGDIKQDKSFMGMPVSFLIDHPIRCSGNTCRDKLSTQLDTVSSLRIFTFYLHWPLVSDGGEVMITIVGASDRPRKISNIIGTIG